jgi:hypothetical protein
MEKRSFLILAGLVLAGIVAVAVGLGIRSSASAAPEVYSSPINGGCYITGPGECKLHVDPFTININDTPGTKLVEFQLFANGKPIYHFRTDVSNPPAADYTPSLVALDFAATCGETYYMNILGRDSLDANLLNMGQTAEFTCPAVVP